MKIIGPFALLAVTASLTLAPGAIAQGDAVPNPEEFTPTGYTFCGWKNFTEPIDQLSWTTEWDENTLSGAFKVGFARNMTCLQATRNIDLIRHTKTPPYRASRTGYRCSRIQTGWELDDVRCIKNGKKATFRYQTGA
jgi:hypothetical protein